MANKHSQLHKRNTQGQTHTYMHITQKWAAASQHIIRCIRCRMISLCLCWCYLQMNSVLCCSKHAPVHSPRKVVRLFLKAVWHTTCLTPLMHSLFNSAWFILSVLPAILPSWSNLTFFASSVFLFHHTFQPSPFSSFKFLFSYFL